MKEPAEHIEMDVTVTPDWNTSVYLEWTAPRSIDPTDLEYIVYTSASEFGDQVALTSSPISDTHLLVNREDTYSKVFRNFYTIEVITPGGEIFRSFPKSPGTGLPRWHQLRHKDIIRRESILLDKFTGAESIVFNRKRSGVRCPSCWDHTHKKVMHDHCEVCYGTSFKGGYETGVNTKLQYLSIDPQSQMSYIGREEPITLSAWTINIPLLHPHSIVLRKGDRKAFRIEGSQGNTELLTNVQKQTVVLKELSKDSIEYKLFNNDCVVDLPLTVPHVHH